MYYFVINPDSGSGRSIILWNQIEQTLLDQNIAFEAIILNGPGDARDVARDLSVTACFSTIVIVGGDGTLNEFINGLTSFEDITLGYIAVGSGNDFARGMNLSSKPLTALEVILKPQKYRNINIGSASIDNHTKRFAISSGIGYDAEVCYESDTSPYKPLLNKLGMGKLVYLINALRMLHSMKPSSVRIILDDQQLLTYEKVYFAAAMNLRYEGGGFMFCPKASPVDDELDLIVVDSIPKWKVLRILPTAFHGKHTRFEGIHIFRCKKAIIQWDVSHHIHGDGESFGESRKVTYSLEKERLRFIVD